jgi:Fe-S-cluster-containing hydrogenase component 2
MKMHRILVVDPEKCTGCRLCEAACSLFKEKKCAPEYARVQVTKWENQGIYIPVVCQQCETPICEVVCPMHAVKRDPNTNAIIIDENTCVGCRLCAQFCPIGGISIDENASRLIKCDLCSGEPVCVEFCQPEALKHIEPLKLGTMKKRTAAEKYSEYLRKTLDTH